MADTEIVDVEKTKLNGEDEIADETGPAAEQTKKKRKRKKKNKTGVVILHECRFAHYAPRPDMCLLGVSWSRSALFSCNQIALNSSVTNTCPAPGGPFCVKSFAIYLTSYQLLNHRCALLSCCCDALHLHLHNYTGRTSIMKANSQACAAKIKVKISRVK